MKFGVVTFPGSNCDQDMIYALEEILKQDVERLWHKDTDLKGVDFVVLPGGFSYGDYLRSGAIAKLSPIMVEVIKHANAGGYVLGVCNGFQILAECGLLEGALLHNENQKFVCKNVHLKLEGKSTAITQGLDPDKTYKIPMAHGEGRFFAPDEVLDRLEKNGQVIFRYCTEDGTISPDANPNGSLRNIAGIANEKGNVFALMPHPERAADINLSNQDGRAMLESIVNHCIQN